ncbi:MAG: M28 family peptidase [Gemmatimonadales bacterium]
MMRRLVLIMTVLACANGGPRTPFDGAAARADVETQVAFGPRVPNTDGHRQAGDWILERLRATVDSVHVQAWNHVTRGGDTLALRNLIGRFRPDATDRVLYIAHWDTRPLADNEDNLGARTRPIAGANDGGSGVAILLGVARVLAATPPSVGVDLLFVDGEDYGDWSDAERQDVLIGSQYFAANLPAGYQPLYAVVWDMVGDADLEIRQEAYSVHRAPEVVERVWRVAEDLGYGRVFRSQVGLGIVDDHIPLLDAGLRAIAVIDFSYGPSNSYWHTHQDTLDKVSAASLQIVGDLAVTLVQ